MNSEQLRRYGRGTGVPDPVDVHVGFRIWSRRVFIGMSQTTLAEALGVSFQQVQKYECAANRVSASALSRIAAELGVPISYFFSGLPPDGSGEVFGGGHEMTRRPEAIELLRSYYDIADKDVRHQFLLMVKAAARSKPR